MKPTNGLFDDQEETDDFDNLASRNNSPPGVAVKVDVKSQERKPITHKSKHSETEQRRRSKINERFQALMDIIPQNDQKRDKASFLLEVIDYIQFLHEKLQMYEGSVQGWNQGPSKLMPWRNNDRPDVNFINNSQVIKDASDAENSALPPAVPILTDSDFDAAAIYKALDHLPDVTLSPPNMKTEPNVVASAGRNVMSSQSLQGYVCETDNIVYQPQSQVCHATPSIMESVVLNNMNEEDTQKGESGSDRLSTIYSQGVLFTLTQALQSSGVDMSQTSVSVNINVAKQLNSERPAASSASKDDHDVEGSQNMLDTRFGNFIAESHQTRKRLKR